MDRMNFFDSKKALRRGKTLLLAVGNGYNHLSAYNFRSGIYASRQIAQLPAKFDKYGNWVQMNSKQLLMGCG